MTHDLLAEALKLPESDRIRLADALYESCEGDPQAWLDEDVFRQTRERLGER